MSLNIQSVMMENISLILMTRPRKELYVLYVNLIDPKKTISLSKWFKDHNLREEYEMYTVIPGIAGDEEAKKYMRELIKNKYESMLEKEQIAAAIENEKQMFNAKGVEKKNAADTSKAAPIPKQAIMNLQIKSLMMVNILKILMARPRNLLDELYNSLNDNKKSISISSWLYEKNLTIEYNMYINIPGISEDKEAREKMRQLIKEKYGEMLENERIDASIKAETQLLKGVAPKKITVMNQPAPSPASNPKASTTQLQQTKIAATLANAQNTLATTLEAKKQHDIPSPPSPKTSFTPGMSSLSNTSHPTLAQQAQVQAEKKVASEAKPIIDTEPPKGNIVFLMESDLDNKKRLFLRFDNKTEKERFLTTFGTKAKELGVGLDTTTLFDLSGNVGGPNELYFNLTLKSSLGTRDMGGGNLVILFDKDPKQAEKLKDLFNEVTGLQSEMDKGTKAAGIDFSNGVLAIPNTKNHLETTIQAAKPKMKAGPG